MVELFCFKKTQQLPRGHLFSKKNNRAVQITPFPNVSHSWSLKMELIDFSLQTFELPQATGCPREGRGALRCPCSLVQAGGVDFSAGRLSRSFLQLSKMKISFKS